LQEQEWAEAAKAGYATAIGRELLALEKLKPKAEELWSKAEDDRFTRQ